MISESKLNSYEGSSPRRELEKAVSEWGFRISENAGSGNCLFFALSEQLNVVKGENIQHDELRKNLVRYLRENPKRADRTDLYVLLDDEQRSQFSTWDQYLANMEKDGVWGDEFIIFAAANRYETCIDLIGNKSKNNIRPEFPVEDGRPLCLGHQYDHHFVSLLLKGVSRKHRPRKLSLKTADFENADLKNFVFDIW
ncbi:putative ubiquitin thioesterase [Stylophora pistillata]|uniref:Putative ubiquitin thioesterase n=1 Tax=Stylophora pistillata TaxID=50429 RepID=A0A2B4RGD7_STYPI|nr:putative ubiquitin thioesterase [Stylophora pistillata]